MKYLIAIVALGFSSPALADSRLVATCTNGVDLTLSLVDDAIVVQMGERRVAPIRVETHSGEEVNFDAERFHMEIITNLDSWEVGILPGTDPEDPHAAFGHVWPEGLGSSSSRPVSVNCRFE